MPTYSALLGIVRLYSPVILLLVKHCSYVLYAFMQNVLEVGGNLLDTIRSPRWSGTDPDSRSVRAMDVVGAVERVASETARAVNFSVTVKSDSIGMFQ